MYLGVILNAEGRIEVEVKQMIIGKIEKRGNLGSYRSKVGIAILIKA